jgi:hypothetical protein
MLPLFPVRSLAFKQPNTFSPFLIAVIYVIQIVDIILTSNPIEDFISILLPVSIEVSFFVVVKSDSFPASRLATWHEEDPQKDHPT